MKTKRNLIQLCLSGTALLLTAFSALANLEVYFAQDVSVAPVGGPNQVPRQTYTNSQAMAVKFLARLHGANTESFEGLPTYPIGQFPTNLVLIFGTNTATLLGSDTNVMSMDTVTDSASTLGGGFPTAGTNCLGIVCGIISQPDVFFKITFSTPQAAFGFYGTDVEINRFRLTLTYADGSTNNIDPSITVPQGSGGVFYLGVINRDKPFTSATFHGLGTSLDGFDFDDMTIGTPENVRAITPGKIVLSGDEWAFSDDGFQKNPTYITNVVKWFGLTPNGAGKKALILDGQSWNCEYNGTCGAFGGDFRSLLTGIGVAVTYLGYTNDLVPLTGFDAVFVDGFMVKATTLTNDLVNFVGAGGAVYLAGGTGTFSPPNATGDAAYWQPFLTTATGYSDFGLVGGTSWFDENPFFNFTGAIGNGVTNLAWFAGQGVQVGNNPNATVAIWDSSHTLVATWTAVLPVQIQSPLLAVPNFSFNFSTVSNQSYTVLQNTNLATTNWTFYTNITGNGSLYQFLSPVSSNRQQFFRVREP